MGDFALLSGTSNLPLATEIAQLLRVPLADREITRFIDSECRVYIKGSVKGKVVMVIQSLSQIADQHLVELCLIGQALKDRGASHIIAVIPWMGYSKQDKAFRPGEAVSSQLVARFIETAGFDAVITVELHSEHVLPFFHIPVTELSTHAVLARALDRKKLSSRAVVASPDKGSKSRTQRFSANIHLPIVYLDKVRDRTTGQVTVKGISGEVKGEDVIIFDDIINSGATAIKTSQFLKTSGARYVYFLATHAVLAGDASSQLDTSPIDQIIVTDTITIPREKKFPKLRVISVAPLLSDAILRQKR